MERITDVRTISKTCQINNKRCLNKPEAMVSFVTDLKIESVIAICVPCLIEWQNYLEENKEKEVNKK